MRKKKSLINIICALLGQGLHIFIQFFIRAVFIRLLSIEYLGVNGLFGNVLTILSLAELGVGNAIIFSLYKPILEKDEEKIKGLMALYDKAYKMIMATILGLGLLVVPFLGVIVKETPQIKENLTFIYILFLLNSLTTYVCAYKRSLVIADQKEYVVTIYTYICNIAANILQIIFLYLTQNFIVYLILQIIFNLGCNLLIARKADKMYPLLMAHKGALLPPEEKRQIFKNIKALILYKIGALLTIGLDNIIISTFMGVGWVGIYCNYTLISDKLTAILSQIFTSVTASVGNLNAEEDMEKKELIYRVLLYVSFWLFGGAGICLYILINPFITLWIGKEYLLDGITVILMASNFYYYGIHHPTMVFRNTMGLYTKGKYRPLIGAAVNGITSILWVKPLGIKGVILGTLLSRLLVLSWYEPLIIYKYGLKKSVKTYYLKYLYYALVVNGAAFICHLVVSPLNDGQCSLLIVKALLTIGITSAIFIGCTFRCEEFKYLWQVVLKLRQILLPNGKGVEV